MKPVIFGVHPEKKDLKPSNCIDYTNQNSSGDSNLGQYIIKIPKFDSGILKDKIIFVDLIPNVFVGQNITTIPPIHKCLERVLKGDTKA